MANNSNLPPGCTERDLPGFLDVEREGPDPDCQSCYGSGFDDADYQLDRFIPLRCACSPVSA